MVSATEWYRHDPINDWRFNHLTLGHADTDKPTPNFPAQAGWVRGKWARYHCWLTDDTPPKVVYVDPNLS